MQIIMDEDEFEEVRDIMDAHEELIERINRAFTVRVTSAGLSEIEVLDMQEAVSIVIDAQDCDL